MRLPQFVTVCGLTQVGMILVGMMAVGVGYKFFITSEFPEERQVIPLTIFIRHHGLCLMLVPIVWTTVTAAIIRRNERTFRQLPHLLSGIVVNLLLAVVMIIAIRSAWAPRQPFLSLPGASLTQMPVDIS